MQYVSAAGDSDDCIFCDHLNAEDDEKAHILYRGSAVFVVLNAFPYNTGHLMVAPFRHIGDLLDMTDEERAETMDVTARSVEVIAEVMGAHGFNVGMNLGRVAGAGIPGHVHMHVVPRWGGDTNYMTTVGETKVLPELIEDTDRKLRPAFQRPSR